MSLLPLAVRVLVADDQRLLREGIASLLEVQEGIAIVGQAASGREAVELALATRPDVVLMDVRMPEMDGIEATSELRRQLPACRVLMLTTFDDDEYILEALKVGATGYLLKDIPSEDLAQAIQAAHKGIYQLDPAVAAKVVASLAGAPNTAGRNIASPDRLASDNLTDREVEVLRLVAQGVTNKEIARTLNISEGTVKNHISSILSRLGLRDRTQAALYAREQGLL